MDLLIENSFYDRLNNQVEYIAQDNFQAAQRFKNNILTQLKRIPKNPYQFRKSIYFDNIHIRDLIYKGYTITFRVAGNKIEVFGFTKYQQTVID